MTPTSKAGVSVWMRPVPRLADRAAAVDSEVAAAVVDVAGIAAAAAAEEAVAAEDVATAGNQPTRS